MTKEIETTEEALPESIPEPKTEGRLMKAVFCFTDAQEIPTGSEYLSTFVIPEASKALHYFLCWTREEEMIPIENPFKFSEVKKDEDNLF